MVAITTGKEMFMQQCEEGGAVLATTQLTLVAAGGVNNTKGNWVQLLAATAGYVKGIVLTLSSNVASRTYLVDIGIGAAAAEQVLIGNIAHFIGAVGPGQNAMKYFFNVRIPSGTRISLRTQCNQSGQQLQAGVHCLY